jgi:hypothetical protein
LTGWYMIVQESAPPPPLSTLLARERALFDSASRQYAESQAQVAHMKARMRESTEVAALMRKPA